MKRIGNYAFNGWNRLNVVSRVTFGSGCSLLRNIKIPEGIEEIGGFNGNQVNHIQTFIYAFLLLADLGEPETANCASRESGFTVFLALFGLPSSTIGFTGIGNRSLRPIVKDELALVSVAGRAGFSIG